MATAPQATRAAVSRADARSRTSRVSRRSYFRTPTRSACPGRGRYMERRAFGFASGGGGSWAMAMVQFSQSRFQITMARGDPRVSPRRSPLITSTRSDSIFILRPRP